ncbi:MAG: chemotaxis protein CheD [Haloferacaceae archaeon]
MEEVTAERLRVGVADLAVTDGAATIVTSGLGSCVAVAIHDGNGVGGLLHAMLPEAPEDTETPAKYVDTGIRTMLDEMAARGGATTRLTAKVAGGSSMLDLGNGTPVGEKNVRATREVLPDVGVDLVAEDTGGNSGRSVLFHPATGTMTIQRVNAADTEL